MRPPDPDSRRLSPALRDLLQLAASDDAETRLTQVEQLAGCTRPIRLHLRHQPGKPQARGTRLAPSRLLIACGNRRTSRCPTCSTIYAADTYHLIRAGLCGGKAIPETVAERPRVFATLTAPSFGPVHHRPDHGRCRCGASHVEDEPLLGTPLHPDTYDYAGAVLFNAHAGQLWAYFTTNLRRILARTARHTPGRLAQELTLSFAKVAEYQKRGLIHFHAILRLDGSTGPAEPPPSWASVEALTDAIRTAVPAAVLHVGGTGPTPRVLAFGTQLDIQAINTNSEDTGTLSVGTVAAYLAKYATKNAGTTGSLDQPIYCQPCRGTGRTPPLAELRTPCPACNGSGRIRPIAELPVDAHTRRMIETCWQLARQPEYAPLKLRRWAHTLGYRGHLTTKSRHYSTTLTALREARHHWHTRHADEPATPNDPPAPDEPKTTWRWGGSGYSPGEELLAETARTRRNNRQQLRHEGEPRP